MTTQQDSQEWEVVDLYTTLPAAKLALCPRCGRGIYSSVVRRGSRVWAERFHIATLERACTYEVKAGFRVRQALSFGYRFGRDARG